MKVISVSAEALPFEKKGGLGDVVGALPDALASYGVESTVILPWYGTIDSELAFEVDFDWGGARERVEIGRSVVSGHSFYFVGLEDFASDHPYGAPDEVRRFLRFAMAAKVLIDELAELGGVDVVHLHDWQAALIAVLCKVHGAHWPVVLTIHNLGHQGQLDADELFEWTRLPRESLFNVDALEYYGDVNLLKGGIVFADRVTTVSESYAAEIQGEEFGMGLGGLLRHHNQKLRGIVNGIDITAWDPATDRYIAAPFTVGQLDGRIACERALADELGLAPPVLGVVSRLAHQKGIDIIIESVESIISTGYSIAVLGAGDRDLEAELENVARRFPGKAVFAPGYDEALAHRIYAGAVGFLMPSRFEPCGLSQLIAMRYGAVPIVHGVGGLRDTVDDGRTGIVFSEPTATALGEAVRRFAASSVENLRDAGMGRNSSWQASAKSYADLYAELVESPSSRARRRR